MFVRIGNKIINLDHVVDVEIQEALPERPAEDTGETLMAIPAKVKLTTTAVDSSYDDGGDLPEFAHTLVHAHTIWLIGEEAELFLSALPHSTPLPEDDEPDVDDSFPVELEYDDNRY